MNVFFEIVMVAALIGAVDVGWFHLYRFRLYAQPGSVAEEVTHLARHVLFLLVVGLALANPPWARVAMAAVFLADVANTVADVLLEQKSREPLGGLPSSEYLLHIVGTLLTGMAAATFWWTEPVALTEVQVARGAVTVALGAVLLLVEGTLFARAVAGRASTGGPVRLPG